MKWTTTIIIIGIISTTIITKSFLNFFERKNLRISINLWEDKKSSK